MKATKTPPPKYDPNGKITTFQINRIMRNCSYQTDTKDEYVQWVTKDVNRTSLRSITQNEAIKIISRQEGLTPAEPIQDNWGFFDKNNKQHLTVLAQMRTAQWTVPNEKYGEVPDLERLSEFLKSDKSPINRPLKDMLPSEVSKIIQALKGIVKSKYK
jgi:hypothetical protein